MKIIKTKIKDLLIIKKDTFKDKRGFLRELYKEKIISKKFIFEIISKSKKNVLRGLHLQKKIQQEKFISVVKGKILDVAVDLRKNSKTFGKHYRTILSENNSRSVFIPKGFAHGFLCLSKKCTVNYKCSEYRNSKFEKTLAWNDKSIKIKWPIKNPILSQKDKDGLDLNSFK